MGFFKCVYSCKYIQLRYLELVIASEIQNSAAGAAELRIMNFGTE